MKKIQMHRFSTILGIRHNFSLGNGETTYNYEIDKSKISNEFCAKFFTEILEKYVFEFNNQEGDMLTYLTVGELQNFFREKYPNRSLELTPDSP